PAAGDADTDAAAAVALPDPFNRAILAADALGGRALALASRLTGTGHTLGDLDAALLHELCERGRDGLADRVATRLAASGRALQQQGRTVTDAAEQVRLVAQAADAFLAGSLPALARLGIVAAA
ncbi:MAG: hypothetical protein EBZ59_04415, partial [Planctomycetia bacterium]|nr:hypothetical protein [Planctomycetia bacterium]